MRTTLNLDADVLEAARVIARQGGRPLGKVISELARGGLRETALPGARNGLPLLARKPGAGAVTLAMVNALREGEA